MAGYKRIKVEYTRVPSAGWHKRLRDGTLVILIDSRYSRKARPMIILHELVEAALMDLDGLVYKSAHTRANQVERAVFGDKLFNEEITETRRILKANRERQHG